MVDPISGVGGISPRPQPQSSQQKTEEAEAPEPIAGFGDVESVDPESDEADEEQHIEAEGVENEELVAGSILGGGDREADPRYAKVRRIGRNGGRGTAISPEMVVQSGGVLSVEQAQRLLKDYQGFWDGITGNTHHSEGPGVYDLKQALAIRAREQALSSGQTEIIRQAGSILKSYQQALEIQQEGARLPLHRSTHIKPISAFPSELRDIIMHSQEITFHALELNNQKIVAAAAMGEILQEMLLGKGSSGRGGR